VSIFGTLFILVLVGIVKYMPQHLFIMHRRAVYYLWGEEGDQRLLGQWFRPGRLSGVGSQKEL
jgi:hypothetical protein